MTKYKSFPLCDVVATQIEMIDDSTRYNFSTADEVSCELVSEEGESSSLTIKKKTIAKKDGVDLIQGYDLTIKDNVFTPEMVCAIQGGKIEKSGTDFKRYTAPTIGVAPTLKAFNTHFYIEVVGEDGATGEYLKYTFPNCKGSLISPSFKDDEYYSSEYTIKSRPALGQGAYTVELVDELPEDVELFEHAAIAYAKEEAALINED